LSTWGGHPASWAAGSTCQTQKSGRMLNRPRKCARSGASAAKACQASSNGNRKRAGVERLQPHDGVGEARRERRESRRGALELTVLGHSAGFRSVFARRTLPKRHWVARDREIAETAAPEALRGGVRQIE
jgi:hypothetical protein